ncbi:hypothetical protein VTO42DRAFT_4992 [Malbranchea cinnamomea]
MANYPLLSPANENVSHTASKTWLSEQTREYETWVKIREALARISPSSPFTPKTFAEWIAHRLARMEEEKRRMLAKIAEKESRKKMPTVTVRRVFWGKILSDHLGLVLARESIWTAFSKPAPGRRLALWPTYEEFRHEGDDRSKSGYSRFLPLPRDPGNETVNWKQRRPLTPYLFDHIEHSPLRARSDSIEDLDLAEQETDYVGESLLKSLDP